MRVIFKWTNILFSIGLVFIAMGVAYIAIPFFGNQALIVRSGSMSPTIDAGSIVVVRPDSKFISPIPFTPIYNEGDIIAFRSEKNAKTIITHRVVNVEIGENGVIYKTKGDANKTVDGWVVKEENILGKTYFTLPFAGRLLAFAKSNIGFPLLVILPAFLVIILEIVKIYKEVRRQKDSFQPQLQSSVNLTNLKVLLPIFMVIFAFGSTSAFFSDSETSVNNTLTAAAIFPGSPGSVVINEINWVGSGLTGQTGQNDEWIELRNMTSSAIDLSGWKITGAVSGIGDFDITSGSIPPNGFFLISNFDETVSRINVIPNIVSTTLQLDNANAQYILKDGSNNVIDTADDGSGAPLAGTNGPPKRSMERKDTPGDGTQAANWQNATTHTGMDGTGPTDEFGTPKNPNGL